ncbi:DUF86 domain-containing protein [Candidatus Fermentibacteria bacterium]|nr:DUF86 domain-containing protein [Candidatus Fermentibacteria bacterium]
MSFEPLEYVRHMLAEADYLTRESQGLSRARFLADPTLRRAFVRSLEVIGEAAKKVPEDLCDRYPAVEWRRVARMRDRLIHGYFGVDYGLIWEVVTERVPTMKRELERVLEAEAS